MTDLLGYANARFVIFLIYFEDTHCIKDDIPIHKNNTVTLNLINTCKYYN